MALMCSVCIRDDRTEIETALLSGTPLRDIAGRTGLSRSALSRHSASHLPTAVLVAAAERDAERADTLAERLEQLYTRAERIVTEAENAGRGNVALAGIRELRGILEFAAKLADGYVPGPPVVIELTFADGTPVHALQAVDKEP